MVTEMRHENQELLFSHNLVNRARRIHSYLCVGLDPEIDRLPAGLPRTAAGVELFCRSIIDATHEFALAFKPNVAFFEALGPEGWAVLDRVRNAIPPGIPVIADAKRGDMGNTARAYARAFFYVYNVDAVTVSPYLGPESLEPFMEYGGKCIFVLARTSNPESERVQHWSQDGVPLYLGVAGWALQLAGPCEVGLVVGATQPQALREIRARYPAPPLLLPGVGAQGATAGAAVDIGYGSRGAVLPSVSRHVLYASNKADFAERARDAASRLAGETWEAACALTCR